MLIAGLVFSILVLIISYGITKAQALDKGLVALCITLIAWGSLVFGIFMSKIPL